MEKHHLNSLSRVGIAELINTTGKIITRMEMHCSREELNLSPMLIGTFIVLPLGDPLFFAGERERAS